MNTPKKEKQPNKDISMLQELILYILKFSQEQGIDNLSKFQIMKLVYLIESEHRKYVGKPFIVQTKFQRDKNGPISKDIYHAIEPLKGKYIKVSETETEGYDYPRTCHRTINMDKFTFSFTKEQKIFLNCVLDDYIKLPQKELRKMVYNTEPMKKILKQEEKTHKKVHGDIDMSAIPLDKDVSQTIAKTSK